MTCGWSVWEWAFLLLAVIVTAGWVAEDVVKAWRRGRRE